MLKNVNIIVILSEEFQGSNNKESIIYQQTFQLQWISSFGQTIYLHTFPLKFCPFTEIEWRESGSNFVPTKENEFVTVDF